MSKDQEYERLHNTEPARRQMFEYCWAIKELSEGLTERNVWDMFRHIETAQRHLDEFRGNFIKTPVLTDDECEIASALHTYMRKSMDCPLGTILYRLIDENRGLPIWYSFIKGLHANNRRYQAGITAADNEYNLNRTTDNLLMLEALRMWEDYDFTDAYDWIKLCDV